MRLRRERLRDDSDGMTLVELLVALFIMSVALLALLGVFGATARSLQDQDARADAVRVAVDRNESYRNAVYTGVAVGTQPAVSVSRGGRTYSAQTIVSEVDAASLGVAGTAAKVKKLATTVTWTVKGSTRTVRYETVLAPDGAVAPVSVPSAAASTAPSPAASTSCAITSVTLSPQPLIVSVPSGVATTSLLVTAVLTGQLTSQSATIAWTNDGGVAKSATLVNTGGSNWSVTVPTADVVHATASGQTSSMNFLLTSACGVTQVTTLSTQGQVSSPPELTSTTITPGTLVLQNGNGNDAGKNKDAVTFTALVSGLASGSTTDSVKVSYTGQNGAAKEIALTRSGTDANKWEHTFAVKTEYFTAGTNQAFTFTVRRSSDGATDSEIKTVTVRY